MRINQTLLVALAFLFVSGCSTAPRSFEAMTASPAEAALDCAVRTVKNIGYIVKNETVGSITAEKKTSGAAKENLFAIGDRLFPGGSSTANKTWSKLTVSVVDTPYGTTSLHVV